MWVEPNTHVRNVFVWLALVEILLQAILLHLQAGAIHQRVCYLK
jgi:hypothetical protein